MDKKQSNYKVNKGMILQKLLQELELPEKYLPNFNINITSGKMTLKFESQTQLKEFMDEIQK
jgi:hypothetical protein